MESFDYASAGLQAPLRRVHPPVGPADLSALVALAAGIAPEAEALRSESECWTYQRLAAAVDAVAVLFQSFGLEVGDRIAASMTNRPDVVIGFFAAMRCGLVWVGVNRVLPAGDKGYILDHSGACAVLADEGMTAEIGGIAAKMTDLKFIVDVDNDVAWRAALAGRDAQAFVPVAIDPFAPATIMYTSGTTGTPKGVVHSQHNMVTVAAAASAHGMMQPKGKRGAVLPLTITNVMILGPVIAFWNRGSFSIGPSAKVEPFVEWLHRDQIAQVSFVPTMVYDLVHSGLEIPACTIAGSGGAPASAALRDRFRERFGYELHTSYGLTEAPTVVALSNGLRGPSDASGRALPHLAVSIRAADNSGLPVGAEGEICVGAVEAGPWAHVYTPALGYWRDADRTAALLAGGVLHTGDIGYLDEEDWLTICDRSSELILRGGSNVYPAEIERVLNLCPGVADCAVVGRPDDRLGQKTVAFVQRTGPDVADAALREVLQAACAEALSRYKLPDAWIIVDALPRNAMGKVVKPALRDLALQASE